MTGPRRRTSSGGSSAASGDSWTSRTGGPPGLGFGARDRADPGGGRRRVLDRPLGTRARHPAARDHRHDQLARLRARRPADPGRRDGARHPARDRARRRPLAAGSARGSGSCSSCSRSCSSSAAPCRRTPGSRSRRPCRRRSSCCCRRPTGGPFTRSLDALVGGVVALLATALIPRDPRRMRRPRGARPCSRCSTRRSARSSTRCATPTRPRANSRCRGCAAPSR